jgi:hypothetical protein
MSDDFLSGMARGRWLRNQAAESILDAASFLLGTEAPSRLNDASYRPD